MMPFVPMILLFGASCWLSYIREIDRLERDEEPNRSGRKFVAIAVAALVITFLFTLWSADAGLILLTLTFHLISVLAGIAAGNAIAWMVYCKRNPEEPEEE